MGLSEALEPSQFHHEAQMLDMGLQDLVLATLDRSEERRVGKEC